MTLGGLWHGAGWTFVLWGTYHGLLLIINHSWQSVSARLAWRRVPKPLAIALTFIFVLFGWVMFRSSNFYSAIIMFESLFDVSSVVLADQYAPAFFEWMRLIAALCSVWLLPNSYQIFAAANPALGNIPEKKLLWFGWRPNIVWAAAIGVCLAITMLPDRPPLSFLYFQF
jgi:alginate O-acetyltransferase complex protein AlgI